MGLLDLSSSASSKKHVDFNNARYQLVDRLRQNNKKTVRPAFTLYDNKEYNKIAVQEISAAYALSDKHLPMGELLNKLVDLIIDLEDGTLDTEKDAIYAWKYSMAVLDMYEDRKKRNEALTSFDNGLKNAVIGSQTFVARYPGKYTNRTNFFDTKVKTEMMNDIIQTFKEYALPKIHSVAIAQSKQVAEKHNNPVLDKIVSWAINNYNCGADSFFEIKEDQATNLFFSVNTIVLHLKNGYDMSIIGHVGTDHDDKFAISVFNANDLTVNNHEERVTQDNIQDALSVAAAQDPVDPLTKLLDFERRKNLVLKQQYEILKTIRPMIPEAALKLKAAEGVVGKDYMWGCEQFRATHDDLPEDFKLSDLELPQIEDDDYYAEKKDAFVSDVANITSTIDKAEELPEAVVASTESKVDEIEKMAAPIEEPKNESATPAKIAESHVEPQVTESTAQIPAKENAPVVEQPAEDPFASLDLEEDLFAPEEKPAPPPEKKFGDPERATFTMPVLPNTSVNKQSFESKVPEKQFDTSSTLLPGLVPVKQVVQEDLSRSVTAQAKPTAAQAKASTVKNTKQEEKPKETSEPFDDLDSLFV